MVTYCNGASGAEVEWVILVHEDDVVDVPDVRIGNGGRNDCGEDIHVDVYVQ